MRDAPPAHGSLPDERLRRLLEELPIGVLVQGPGAEILYSNRAALHGLGLTEDELLGKTSFDPSWHVVHEDGSPFPGETHPVPRAIETRRPVRDVLMGVYHPLRRDYTWLLVNAEPNLRADGSVDHVICVFLDVTERRLAVETLRESQERYRLLFERNVAAVYHSTVDGEILECNAAFAQLLGFGSPAEARSVPASSLYARAEGRPSLLSRLKEKGFLANFETELRRRDGSTVWVLESESYLPGKDGEPDTLLGTMIDITDRKRREEELIRSAEIARPALPIAAGSAGE